MTTPPWKVIPHRDVLRKDIPLLKNAGLYDNFIEIVDTLKINPYSREHNQESLQPHNRHIYSMRINIQHRCVYTIDKKGHLVKIWSAWSHYEKRLPLK